MEKIIIVDGTNREKTLEEVLEDIVAVQSGTINQVIWKERAGYWVVWYTVT